MRFNFYISKTANLFFFVSNLAACFPSCREEYNKEWIKLTGKLTQEERESLKKSREIIRKYTNRNLKFKYDYLDIVFTTSKNKSQLWRRIKKLTAEKEFELLQKVFSGLSPRFEKIWEVARPKLFINKKNFEYFIKSNKEKIKFILSDLADFYGERVPKGSINIFLIYVPIKKGGGGKAREKRIILLERGVVKKNSYELRQAIAILIHEIIHSFFEGNYLKKLTYNFMRKIGVKKFIKVGKTKYDLEILLREAIASSLTPQGYLAEKYFNLPVKERAKKFLKGRNLKKSFLDQRILFRYISLVGYDLAKEYVNNKRRIDQNYLKNIYSFIIELKKRARET